MKLKSSVELEKLPAHTLLFVSPSDWEKERWVEIVATAQKKKDPEAQVIKFSAVETPASQLQMEICTPDLLGGARIFVIDEIDKVKGVQLTGNSTTIVILLASTFKPVSYLYREEVALLDVSGEKPWDRDRRVHEWIQAEVRERGKEMSAEAAALLISLIGSDFALLHQEIKKLALYAPKNRIEPQDIEAVCGARDLLTGWQLAEAAIWRGPVALQEKGKDPGFMIPFVGQVRYQLQLGAQVVELLQHSRNLESHLPSVRPQMLKKIAPLAKERGLQFFLRGLTALYELEFASKSSSLDLSVLFDTFQAKLYAKAHSTS